MWSLCMREVLLTDYGCVLGMPLARYPLVTTRGDIQAPQQSQDVGCRVEVIVAPLTGDEQNASNANEKGQALADQPKHEKAENEREDRARNFHIHKSTTPLVAGGAREGR